MPNGKVQYTRRADDSGWLRIKLANGSFAFLCEYTRLELTKEADGRVFFKVTDGYTCVGQEASLSKVNAAQYLSDQGPQGPAQVSVRYTGEPSYEDSLFRGHLLQQWGELTVPGVVTAQITLNSQNERTREIERMNRKKFTPIPPGTHTILAPDGSHSLNANTRRYAVETRGMVGNDIWFPIGLNGSMVNSTRYIHVGHLSEGCVTMHELMKWTALYNYLISHRVPGSAGKRIGQMVVRK